MLKRIYFMALVLASATAVLASPIDKQSALTAAKAFLAEKGSPMRLLESKPIRAAKSSSPQSEESYYYIFNAADNGGFVIMSGDDMLEPVLGYADQGHIDTDNMPDGLKALLDSYKEVIDDMGKQAASGMVETSVPSGARRSMSRAKYPVKPFLTKFWGHRDPFNRLNPIINDSICPTGCVTVAVAEVMGYYEYPKSMKAVSGYTTLTRQIDLEKLPAIDIEWTNMLPNYSTESYDDVQSTAVSTLMRYLGQGLKSDFNTSSTAVPASNITTLFKNYGYNSSAFTKMTSKTDNEWEEIYYENLINKRPVIICASNILNNGSGHCFLIDGYDQDGLYHIDWGWTGNSDGFFRITNLSPYRNTRSYTYMSRQYVIWNIVPKVMQGEEEHYANAADGCLTTTAIKIENKIDITITRKNTTGAARTFKQGIGLVDQTNTLVKVLEWDTLTYKSNGSSTMHWNVLNLSGVKDGTYRIYPISQIDDADDTWHFDICKSTNAYVELVTSMGKSTLTAKKAIVYNSFATDSTLTHIHGAARKYKLSITNNTMDKLQKRFYFYEDTIPMDYQVCNIPLNSTGDLEVTYIPQSVGKHILRICTDTLKNATSEVVKSVEVNVSAPVSYKLSVTKTKLDNFNNDAGALYGNSIHIVYTIKNTGTHDYDDFVRVLLKQGSWYNTLKKLVHIPVGESQEVEFECNDLVYGISYPLSFLYKSASNTDPDILNTTLWSSTYKPRPAICMWKTDGRLLAKVPSAAPLTVPENVVALNLSGLTKVPSDITPNSNPNTLYSVTQLYESLDSLNQIVDGHAEHIRLADGYSAYVPFKFHADTITYTRTFDKGFTGRRNGNNWSTIVLPFNVQKVFNTVDSVEVDWFRPGDETEKNFWLRHFYGDDGGYAYFEDAAEMKAYVPYIITVPGDYKGEEYRLVGKPLEFCATDIDIDKGKAVADGGSHNFQGSTLATSTYGANIYFLDENGNSFVYTKEESTVQPFRAYFTSDVAPAVASSSHRTSASTRPTASWNSPRQLRKSTPRSAASTPSAARRCAAPAAPR